MKVKSLFWILILAILFAVPAFSQSKDSLNNINVKELSREEALRIFGPLKRKMFNKVTGYPSEIKDITIKGNKITTKLYNYGSIAHPTLSLDDIDDLVWNGLGYGFEFGLLAGAEVTGVDGEKLHIISDSHVLSGQGDYNSDASLKWGWLPKLGYADPTQDEIASLNAKDLNGDGKPDSWPESWYSPGAGKYLWPAFLGDMATSPDEEVYYAIDDYTNYEFIDRYQPFPSDPTKGGLGLDTYVRVLQFNNPMAEDIIFTVYTMTNASGKDLNKLYVGMFGDPHIGGAGDYTDDMAYFIPPTGEIADRYDQRERSMVYGWDEDGEGHGGREPGYFGWKFLESPSLENDGEDNDDDGITDESPFNGKGQFIDGVTTPLETGISDVAQYTSVYGAPKARWSGDEDGDWDIEKHDTGIDGIGVESANYPGPDYGEGDGEPSQAWFQDLNGNGSFDRDEAGTLSDVQLPGYRWAGSEPNFGYRDVSESDQLGLTGFTAASYGDPNFPKNDPLIWEWFTKPEIDTEQELLQTAGDNIFAFSTGPTFLAQGETQRFSMAIIMGENLQDLRLNAKTSVRILEADYRFAQPPAKPFVTAVPGDGKVTLYWDAKSEESIDPLTTQKDFEGYKIYRSRDYNFTDVYKITDANGVPFLGQALFDPNTGDLAQWDLVNDFSGLAPVEYDGRGVRYNLGANTGLVHEYVDSTVKNGITYYYAVVAYDHGTEELPPTETQSVIQEDPLTGELLFDVNTVSVVPGPISSGIEDPKVGDEGLTQHIEGIATGDVYVKLLNEHFVQNKIYKIEFQDTTYYNVLDSTGVKYDFTSKDTVLVSLRHRNIQSGSVKVYDMNNNLIPESEYLVNSVTGQIRGKTMNSLPEGETFTVEYRYYPVYRSMLFDFQDGNPSFDGMRVYVQNEDLEINHEASRFLNNSDVTVNGEVIFPPSIGTNNQHVKLPKDWEIRWLNTEQDAEGNWLYADTVETALGNRAVPFEVYVLPENQKTNFLIYEPNKSTSNNQQWDWGEAIAMQPLIEPGVDISFQVFFRKDTAAANQALPTEGDVFLLKTKKPFADDSYVFNTEEMEFKPETAKDMVNDIYVVPNPYVSYSMLENPGRTLTKRGDRVLQFRNLPPQCTIRIYTVTGELVDTIEKDDNTSIASWDLLSDEGMRIAYGVYIYHVDIPEVGEKIGRFAVIK